MAKIAERISKLTGSDEATRKAKEQFTFLQKMAEAKSAEFKAELQQMYIGKGAEQSEVTGHRAINYYSAQHVDIAIGCNAAITSAIDSFFDGKDGVKDGFHKLVTGAIEALIGNSSIGEHKEDMFFIYPENYAIVRVDVKAYKYTFSEKGLIANCENVFCYTMAKSIVDHTTLTKDELMYFVAQMCKGRNSSVESDKVKEVPLSEILGFVKELIEVWNLLDTQITPRNDGLLQTAGAPSRTLSLEELDAFVRRA